MRSRLGTVLTGGALVLLAAPASAAVRYAEPGGDGPALSCPKSNPCEIHDAAESPGADDGDEVIVLPGTYNIGSDTIELSDQINLHGALGGQRPVITSSGGGGPTLDGSPATRIHDLVLRSFDDAPPFGALGTFDSAVRVERVVAISENAHGCSFPPVIPGFMRDTVCATGGNAAAINSELNGVSATFTHRLRNVTAVAHGLNGDGIRVATDNLTFTVEARNVIAMSPSGIGNFDVVAEETGTGSVSINLAYSNYASVAGATNVTDPATNNNQQEPPLLTDPEGGDFHQLSGSPTINAGGGPGDVDLLGALDFERQPRVQGSAPDIGADELDDRLKLKAKGKKRQKAKKLRVKVSCPEEECYVVAKGRATAGGEKFKLKKTKRRFLEAGEKSKLRLKAKHAGELKDLLANSAGKAKITVRGTDAGGVKAKKKLKVELSG